MSLRHVILTVLSEREASGYDIARAFDESLSFFWNASHQQLYHDLKRLERDGLVTATLVKQSHRPDKKTYRITAAGQDYLDRWLAEPVETRVNSALMVKLTGLARAAPERALTLLSEQRGFHAGKLQRYRDIYRLHFEGVPTESLPYPLLLHFLTLRRGLRGEEDWIGWIDESIALIRRHQRDGM